MTPAAIVVDWGTSSFRASLVAEGGGRLDHVQTDQGIAALQQGDHERVLMAALGPWFGTHGALPVVGLGMVTSRDGWRELPYVSCPASAADLARGAARQSLPNGSDLVLLSGLTDPAAHPFPDVMRGEETQIAGHGLDRDATVILPGTHSKWAQVTDGRIAAFRTFVTGEVFALLMRHSFIARGAEETDDTAAFRQGLDAAQTSPAMLSLLFAARTGRLAGRLSPDGMRSFVSGLVIGQEFAQARALGLCPKGRVSIVGNDALTALYSTAADAFGLSVDPGPGEEAVRGALAILRHVLPADGHPRPIG